MSSSNSSRHSDKFVARLPDGMRDQIAAAARENRRSMNAEVVFHLGRAMQSRALSTELLERTSPRRPARVFRPKLPK